MSGAVVVASLEAYFLGEGPIWDPLRQQLIWVDIDAGEAHAADLREDGTLDVRYSVSVGGTLGAVAVAADGDWILAAGDRILHRTADGRIEEGPRLLSPGSGRRCNDGGVDPAGRFLVGTLCIDGASRREQLLQITDSGTHVLDEDLTLSNGLAWSSNGRTLFSVDSDRREVFRRPYDPLTGCAGRRETFLVLDDGYPDGLTIDAEGHVWLAVWGAGEVRRYSPDGRLVDRISVPAPHTSSVAFAGPALDTLVITTAREGLGDEALQDHPLSGHLFSVRPGVVGLPQPYWHGIRHVVSNHYGTDHDE